MAQTAERLKQAPARPVRPVRPAERLAAWYARARRDLPWRARPGERADPYRVWLSEIMLQQTVVKAAAPYFARFTERWPTVDALAAAPLDDVLKEWAGLGYYARARNLHACAVIVAREHGGRFPDTEEALLRLPGIGQYTAAAIAAIAFDRQTVPVDGNVERVMARYHALDAPLPEIKGAIREKAQALLPADHPADLAQALMDLGASLCSPRRPACSLCPLNEDCAGHALGIAEELPVRAVKRERPTRRAAIFWLERDGKVLLRKRPAKGLLGGMSEFPSSPWVEGDLPQAPDAAPARADWQRVPGMVRHVFTHFALELAVWRAVAPRGVVLSDDANEARCIWVERARLDAEALPSVMRKVAAHAME